MGSDESDGSRCDGVKVVGATAAKNHAPGPEVLDKETKRVKFN
jgi:hypothetical protein